MIKEDKVLVNINHRNLKMYQNLGYNIDIDTKQVEISIKDVSKNSKIRITSICDICGKDGNISINKYWKNFERGGYNFYSCFGCKNKKKELTTLSIYGVKSFSQTEDFKSKFKETSLKNYGVDNPNKNKQIRDKIKKTNIDKYGVSTILLTKENIEKSRIWMSSDEFKVKSKKSINEIYGTDSYSKTEEFKKVIESKKSLIISKIKQTFIEKYGVEWYSKTEESKIKHRESKEISEEKRKNTCLEKYGVTNVALNKDIYKKIYQSKIDKGIIIPDEDLTDWQLYKRKVNRVTNKFKKELYENWNGYDYYDSELIRGYLSHSHTHRFYPTIDHKISLLYGFINNVSPEEIGDISNLCITKRYINSMKNSLIEEKFTML